MRVPIGELLVKCGMITSDQLAQALERQKHEKKRLGELLVEMGYLNSNDLVWMLSEQASIPFVEVRPEMLDAKLINSFPQKILYDYQVLPLYQTEDRVFVALGDPTNQEVVKKLEESTGKQIVVSGADPKVVEQFLDKFYLSEQTDRLLEAPPGGSITLEVSDGKADLRVADKDGNSTKEKVRVKIIVKIDREQEKPHE